MIIAFDVDDVLLRLYAAFAAFHNERYETFLSEDDFFSYFLWEVLGTTREECIVRMEDFYRTDAFRYLPLVDGAQDGVRALFRRHSLVAVTGRPEGVAEITRLQLYRHFPGLFRSVHHTGAFVAGMPARPKSAVCRELGADVILEDALCHAVECANAGMRVILFDRPWNRETVVCERGVGSVERVFSWDEAVTLLM